MQGYLNNQREHVFRSVSVLIFVFDIESREVEVRRSRTIDSPRSLHRVPQPH